MVDDIKENISESCSNFNLNNKKEKEKTDKLVSGLFLSVVTAFSLLTGFSYSLGATKKQDLKHYAKGTKPSLNDLHESGVQLARRALLRATIYSVSGFSLFCLAVWKLSGVSSFEEFRYKAGNVLPRIKRNNEEEGRTEFENLTELFQYLIDEDKKKRASSPKNED